MSKTNKLPPCPPEYTPEEWAEYHRDPCSWCIKELKNKSAEIRCNAADILRGLGGDAVTAIPALIEGCRDRNQQVRTYSAQALADIAYVVNRKIPAAQTSLKAAVPALSKMLSAKSIDARCTAIYALGSIGTSAKSCLPALRKLANHRNQELREYAKTAIESIST